MSALLNAAGQPIAPQRQQVQPLLNQDVERVLGQLTGESGRWILEAIDTWTKRQVALCEHANNEPAVFNMLLLPATADFPIAAADGVITTRRVWSLQIQIIAKADAESRLRQQPRWMSMQSAFVEVAEDAEQTVRAVVGFHAQNIVTYHKPEEPSRIALQ